ncbi:peptidase M23-like protein [Kineococcus xinjiangensis]|uniref:Peptidase M23-like protein n=1 Tax=Kineococcus xinjiangensis TaxID=512762 RepID=A0A2S6ICJ4_9ACTN|nr:M23 family metallopeptidase [Kineococcus xinjiangensis]PPK91944.1 peptidase M23-like protein [Kineococcus xinjiangensis]
MNRRNGSLLLGALIAVPVGFTLVLVLVVGLVSAQPAQANCGVSGPGLTVDPSTVPAAVGPYRGVQLVNAALIINAGKALGISARGQTIGVMTAIGESTLIVVDHGDLAGPDSRGLFQQRANGAWGSYEDRMNPTISATNFFKALLRVQGWETLAPTIAAHRTQRNANPFHYEKYWDDAVQIMGALAGARVIDGAAPGTGGLPCTDPIAPPPGTGSGWIKPAVGPLTSGYGPRGSCGGVCSTFHRGADIGAACGTPIYAASAGVVVTAGRSGGYGNLIAIDHGGGIVTRYAHMYDSGMLTRVGAAVTTSQQIARVGSFGNSTGCHLHFEVLEAGTRINPEPFMAARGAALR